MGRKGRLVPKNAHLIRDLALSQSLPWGLVKSLGREVGVSDKCLSGTEFRKARVVPSRLSQTEVNEETAFRVPTLVRM